MGDGIEVNPLAWAAIEDVSNKIKITGGAGQSLTYDTTYTILILYYIILYYIISFIFFKIIFQMI